jgi:hypothetical protein
MGGFRADIVLVGSAAVGAGRSEGLARVLLLLSPVGVRVVEKQELWIKTLSGRSSKLRMFQGEGVISKCLKGRLTDATNKLRASTVDVIRESRRRGPVKEQLDGVQFWKQSKGPCAKRRKQHRHQRD